MKPYAPALPTTFMSCATSRPSALTPVRKLALAALTGITLTIRRGRTALASALPLAPFFATGALIALALT